MGEDGTEQEDERKKEEEKCGPAPLSSHQSVFGNEIHVRICSRERERERKLVRGRPLIDRHNQINRSVGNEGASQIIPR